MSKIPGLGNIPTTQDERQRLLIEERRKTNVGYELLSDEEIAAELADERQERNKLFPLQTDWSNSGFTLIENTISPEEISIPDLTLINFFRAKEGNITGTEIAKRARIKRANLGQRHAEYLLEHEKEIPNEWRKYLLVFPGTVWQKGYLYSPYLSDASGNWLMDLGNLELPWASYCRLLGTRKKKARE